MTTSTSVSRGLTPSSPSTTNRGGASRRILALATAAAVAVTLAGCGAGVGGPSTTFDVDGVTGAFDWQRYSGDSVDVMLNEHPWTSGVKERLGEFEELTGIKVNLRAYSESLYYDKMAQGVRSATPPDVYMIGMDDFALGQYDADLVEPLTPFIESSSLTSDGYDFADFPENLLSTGMFPVGADDAQLYQIPISTEVSMLFYNEQLVDEYLGGVVPTTMRELIAAAEKISTDSNGEVFGALMRGVRSDLTLGTMTGLVFNQVPADAAIEQPYNVWFDGAWDKPTLEEPGVKQGLVDYAKLLATGPSNKFNIDWADANALFTQGKAAFYIDASVFGPSFEDPAASLIAGNVGYEALPKGDAEGTTGAWSWALSMSKKSANKGAAWLFIQWVTGKDTSAGLGALTGGAPRSSAASDAEYLSSFDEEYITTTAALISEARNISVMRLNWKDGAYIIVDAMLEIAQGADVDETLAAANEKLGSAFS